MKKRISIPIHLFDNEDVFVVFYEGTPLAGVCRSLMEAHSCASCWELPANTGRVTSMRWEGGLPSIVTAVWKYCRLVKLTPVFVVMAS